MAAMKFYTIAELDITDRAWVSSYVAAVTPMVERAGGRYLARTSNITKLEGQRPPAQLYVMVEWPSREAAETFYASDEYRPWLEARLAGAENELVMVAGEDVTRR